MGLLSLQIENYQSYREPRLVMFDPHLTLIAGQNDVGKSALLRVLRLFAERQQGAGPNLSLTLTWHIETSQLLENLPVGSPAQLVDWFRERESHTLRVTYRRNNGNPGISGEDLQAVRIELEELGGVAQGQVGTQPGWDSGPMAGSATGHDVPVTLAAQLARNVAFVGPRALPGGQLQLQAQRELAADGSNLVNVLHTLHASRSEVFDAIETFMRAAFPQIEQIAVILDENSAPLQGQPAVLYRHRPDDPILLRDTGSGVAQLLTLATGILTNREGRLFLIDEPQAYLHPRAEHDLLALLEEHDEHQYVVATHSSYWLNSRPLSHARLLRIVDGATDVVDATQDALLEELGITAADLWLAERILWVEGASELSVFALLLSELAPRDRSKIHVKKMPIAASIFSVSGGGAELPFRFLEEVFDATRATRVAMRFVFDRDERSDDQVERLREVSNGLAEVLSVRELENYFLVPELIHRALVGFCEAIGHALPSEDNVRQRLDELLADIENPRLFPVGLPEGESAERHVRGSAVLRELWWEFATSEYDKAKHVDALAQLALQQSPALLNPLRNVINDLLAQEL